ncbi:MAG: restriction endonuclease subunit S [Verrucomicrobia bacterium]|nr:restriction endonuclease subunit S [Verrucomicrobiota bacterium]MDA1005216.1 restriction endonuclease subunit S [Verrucomicrobiota bacterium]
MSFPRYPKYKDSGVEWLGEVPVHWETKRIGYYFSERCEKVSDKDYRALSVTMGGIVPQIDTAAKSDDSDNRKRVCQGDFVINSRSDRKGSSGVSDLEGSVSLISIVLRPHDASAVHMPFVHHLLRSQLFQEEFYRNGKGIVADLWSTNYSSMRNILLAVPDPPEQSAIAAFLDRETAKIDGLVAEQRRLMELLKEKRQAVISHAVTKGLNPDAPMKPSGIEWLGDVPEHWRAGKCGFYLTVLSGFAFPSVGFTQDENDTKLLRGINVGVSKLRWSETVYWRRSEGDGLDCYEMKAGDLVIGMDRPLIGGGVRVAMISEDDLPCLLLQRVASLTPAELLSSHYLLRLLSSEMFQAHFLPDTTGVSVPHISPTQIGDFVIPIPPREEQDVITDYLAAEIGKLATLTAETQRAIDLLQERRTALISAAVTGQIDVRQLATGDAA